MDQRKLIKLGNSSFAIALPKQWVDKSGLKKGDNVFISPNSNGELIIQPRYGGDIEEKEITLNFENKMDKEMEREISSAYIKDYNIFKIIGLNNNNKKEYVEHLLKSLISLEIIEKNKSSIVAKDFFDLSETNLRSFLRRGDNSLRNMFEEVETLLRKGTISDKELKEIYKIDWDINRLYFLVYRIFIKSLKNPSLLNTLKIDSLTLLDAWQITVSIGKIGDNIKDICKLINHNKNIKELETISRLFLDAKDIYLETLLAYYNQDVSLAKKMNSYREEKIKKCEALAKNKDFNVMQIAEKFEHLFASIHELSKLILYAMAQNV